MIIRINRILYFLFIFLLMCCSKENPVESKLSVYKGNWLWLKTEGGIFPGIVAPEEGTILKISFNNFNTFKIYRNDSLKVITKYRIEEGENNFDKIYYSDIKTYDYYFNSNFDLALIFSDTLKLWDGNIDGFFSFYKKIK